MSHRHQSRSERTVSGDAEAMTGLIRTNTQDLQPASHSQKPALSQPTSSSDVRTSRRKPAPSPLQTVQSSSPITNGARDTASAGPSGLPFPEPPPNRSFSSRSFYDRLPAAQEQTRSAQAPVEAAPSRPAVQDEPRDADEPSTPVQGSYVVQGATTSLSPPSDRQVRDSSASTFLTQPGGASPSSRAYKTAMAALTHQTDPWSSVRKSSIDSAISSISRKSSEDSVSSTPADIANLSTAAGSPEAAIQYLLKEKQASAAQNAQLWRLVDKQRTMILGLNKDLERALHDKEKYRKRLKEHLNRQPPMPTIKVHARTASTSPHGDADTDRTRSQGSDPTDPGTSSVKDLDEQQTSGAAEAIRSSHGLTPPASRESSTSERREMSRANKAGVKPLGESGRIITAPLSPQDSESASEARTLSPESPSPKSVKAEDPSWRPGAAGEKRSQVLLGASHAPPSFALSEPSPPIEQHPRKNPPIPLNLEPSKLRGVHLQRLGADDHSGSEYEDGLEADEMTTFERGRRKTRDEDDRIREILAMKEQERRSRSKKEKSVTAVSGKTDHSTPSSNAATSQQTVNIPALEEPPSTANLLSPSSQAPYPAMKSPLPLALRQLKSEGGPIGTQRVLAPSPMSPGLPMSPRPTDRPLNSPMPRLPREQAGLAGLSSPLFSPRPGFPGLPMSPRAAKQPLPFPPATPMTPSMPRFVPQTLAPTSHDNSPPSSQPQTVAIKGMTGEYQASEKAVSPEESPDHGKFSTSAKPLSNNTSYLLGPEGRAKKDGYLTKRGKNFGGWKTRFFLLDGSMLRYYEAPRGPHLGTIRLKNAQIEKQPDHRSDTSPPNGNHDHEHDNEYRYAFIVLEPKKKDASSHVRHVLCADSETERDEWVVALLHYVDDSASDEEYYPQPMSKAAAYDARGKDPEHPRMTHVKMVLPEKDPLHRNQDVDGLRGLSYEDTVQAEAPVRGATGRPSEPPPSPSMAQSNGSFQRSQISRPTNGAVIQDAGAWGNKSRPYNSPDKKEPKKKGLWGFKSRTLSDTNVLAPSSPVHSTGFIQPHATAGRGGIVRAVFGAPLADVTENSQPFGVEVYLPAVVYRCIEYLDVKEAANEEGIFRLSGSSVVIKSLRERFNSEGDVNFLAESQYYDVHAVASLLKMYLRELPASVLTRELHLDFLHVIGELSSVIRLGRSMMLTTVRIGYQREEG